jgi:sulfate transport system substrate-binding protein
MTFVERKIGDVLITWENEALLGIEKLGKDNLELVVPSISILAEPPVSVVDGVVDRKGTRDVAEAYLKFLYTPEAQEIVAKHYFRPRDPAVLAKYEGKFKQVNLFAIDELGGWKAAQAKHFADGGVFDQVTKK